jgi:Flp pilus assembly protein TadG
MRHVLHQVRTIVRRCLRCVRGASAVEFALVTPLFLAMVFGIIMFGSYLAVIHGVQQLAAEAARTSIAGLSDSERGDLARNYVTAHAAAYPLIVPAQVSVNAAASPSDANVFVVTVNYDASGLFIYSLPSFVPVPSSAIARSAAIPRGGY